jgi:hypothetical protein
MGPNNQPPTDVESLSQAVRMCKVYCGIILLSLAQYSQGLRDKIIGNFIARGMICTESIFLIWQQGGEQDAWILHRSLLDRLFHLHNLVEHNFFSAFEEYSFMRAYEARQKLLADKEMRNKFSASQIKGLKQLLKSQEARYQQLKGKLPIWHRPKAEDDAKSMNLGFLYHFGYDYASRYVHPTAEDGEIDFVRLTSPANHESLPDATVVRNSILVQSMLIREALNATSVQWRTIIYDFINQLQKFLKGDKDLKFQETFYKIGNAWPAVDFCEPRPDK